MNAVEIEQAISELADSAFNAADFPLAFLEAFGNKAATIKRLRTGGYNKSDIGGMHRPAAPTAFLALHRANWYRTFCTSCHTPEELSMPSRRSIFTLLFILSIILYGAAIFFDLMSGARGYQFYLVIAAIFTNIAILVMYRRQTGGRL